MPTSVAANLLEMGFTKERAREAILTVRRLRGQFEVSIEEVISWMLEDGNTQNQEPADRDTKSLNTENKQLKQMQLCKICMVKYFRITFLPCGHLVCCEGCATNMRTCPICRKRIKGQVRTFMS